MRQTILCFVFFRREKVFDSIIFDFLGFFGQNDNKNALFAFFRVFFFQNRTIYAVRDFRKK
jgi:hypothetical protein